MRGPASSSIPVSWGWTSYRRAGWVNQQGQRLYVVHFQSIEAPNGYIRITLHIWARRPVLALRALCRRKRASKNFSGTTGPPLISTHTASRLRPSLISVYVLNGTHPTS